MKQVTESFAETTADNALRDIVTSLAYAVSDTCKGKVNALKVEEKKTNEIALFSQFTQQGKIGLS